MRKIYNYKMIASSLLLKSRKLVKGSISLLLILIVTPLLGMTLMMVESIRYQDVIEEMIEINDLCSYATLGNYDPFLRERFGLLAVSQDKEVSELYNKYFVENKRLVSNDILIKSCKIDGEYSLDDLAVMKMQILDYAEYSAFFDAVFEGGNLTEIFDSVNEAIGVDKLQTLADNLDDGAKLADALAKASEAIKDTSEYIDKEFTPALDRYNDAYDDFEDKLNDYIKALNDYKGNKSKIYDDKNVKDAWEKLAEVSNPPTDEYQDACDDLVKKINDLKVKIDDVAVLLKDASAAYDKLEEARKNQDQGSKTGFSFTMSVAGTLLPLMEAIADENYEKKFSKPAEDLEKLSKNIKDMEMDEFDSDSSKDDTRDDWYVEIDTVESVSECIKLFVKGFDNLDTKTKTETAKDLIDAFISFVDLPCMMDSNLRAKIDYEKYHELNTLITSEDISNWLGIQGIAALIDCVEGMKFPEDLLNILFLQTEIFIATTALATGLLLWVQNITTNTLLNTTINLGNMWDKAILCGYAAYNFPNRTNYMESVDLTGYNYGMEIYKEVCGQDLDKAGIDEMRDAYRSISFTRKMARPILEGSIFELSNSMTFYGAEQEYILCGWKNEVYNQCGAYYNILMLRLAFDLVPLFKDEAVKSMAQEAGAYAWLVYILVLLGDALLDAFILANGGDIPLIKFECYCTPEGVLSMVSDLASLSNCTEKAGEVISKVAPMCKMIDEKNFSGLNPFKDGVLPFSSYTDHMFILFMLCEQEQQIWYRMQNVIINESRAYYDHYNKEFKIENSFTYVRSDIVYEINPMFDFTSLTNNAVFKKTVNLERHIGY